MTRKTIEDLKNQRLEAMSAEERALFESEYAAARLALEVGERIRDAREAAGLSQRELAARMGTSQAAVARLEAGGVGATLTTLQNSRETRLLLGRSRGLGRGVNRSEIWLAQVGRKRRPVLI